MTTYKNIKGKRVKTFATDLDNDQAEGQIFYSSTDNQFKTAVNSAAWSSTSPLLTGRVNIGSSGTQTAGLAWCGDPGSSPNLSNSTEEYNGSGWASSGDFTVSTRRVLGAGTQTASVAAGGDVAPNAASFEYDGSSWTAGNDINTGRTQHDMAGTQTAGLMFGGRPPDFLDSTEEYDGTNWTNGGSLNTARARLSGNGLQTAAIAMGGNPTPGAGTATEEYNGSSWTSSGAMNNVRRQAASTGIQTDAIIFGGDANPGFLNKTENYNGTSWTENPATLGTAINGHGGAGTSSASVSFGGYTGTVYTSATEEYNVTVNTITAAAWSSGGNLNTARSRGTGGGTLTAGICVNGVTVNVEEYDGTSWTEQNNMPAALRDMSGFGTQTAFVGCAGYQPGVSPVNPGSTNEYDGTNWTSGGTMNVGRDGTSLHFGGVLTAGLVNGGGVPPYKQTEEYNGTSWANGNASSQDHYRTNITGTQTAAFVFGGYGVDPGGPQAGLSVTFTEEYDGTNFSSGDTLLQGANAPLGMSNSNKDDSTCAGGFDQAASARLSLTQNYNGTVWATGASLGTARYAGTGGGSAAGGFVAAGHVPPTTTATEELTAETTSLNLKTITDS